MKTTRLISMLTASCFLVTTVGTFAKAPPAPKKTPTKAQIHSLLVSNKCLKCHNLDTEGKQGKKVVSLTHEGKEHDYTWIYEKIENPKSKKANSHMPIKKMTPAQRSLIAAYLASRK